MSTKKFLDMVTYAVLLLLSLLVVIPFVLIVSNIAINGVGNLSIELITQLPSEMGLKGGILNAIVGTFYLIIIAAVVSVPLSVGAAVYISEYTRSGRVREMIEFMSDVLSGIPSIVFGAFGFTFFVYYMNMGISLLAGALTLAVMMIPTVLRATEESLKAVSRSLREASYALGATRWTTTWSITIRSALPGVLTGVLLAIGRIGGETAPLLFTAGYNIYLPTSLFDWTASLPFIIFIFTESPFSQLHAKAFAASFILVIIMLGINLTTKIISRRLSRGVVE